MGQQDKSKFDFWNDHSVAFLEMSMKRDYQETVHQADGYGTAQRECGDTIMFFLMADGYQITAISYDIKGCIYTHACANTIIHLAKDKDIREVLTIREADIIEYLETLPEKEHHCATLALKAFRQAVESLKTT
ncbi:MAG: iron-sulfur cluster assembly scaffold protein [Desulfobacterales bacterium]|nr:iron-sulfur cluster assembly scaffold protein [Desulfobacterales bacterium]